MLASNFDFQNSGHKLYSELLLNNNNFSNVTCSYSAAAEFYYWTTISSIVSSSVSEAAAALPKNEAWRKMVTIDAPEKRKSGSFREASWLKIYMYSENQ